MTKIPAPKEWIDKEVKIELVESDEDRYITKGECEEIVKSIIIAQIKEGYI